jgi:hypothetical protein
MRMKAAATMIAVLVPGACADNPAAPVQVASITSIRYERERPHDPTVSREVFLELTYPIVGDPYGRSRFSGCLLEPRAPGVFACPEILTWQVPADMDCGLQVFDPALTMNEVRAVATAVFVNGQRLQRVEVFANGVEVGRFRVTPSGEIR